MAVGFASMIEKVVRITTGSPTSMSEGIDLLIQDEESRANALLPWSREVYYRNPSMSGLCQTADMLQ